jgi:putative transposase
VQSFAFEPGCRLLIREDLLAPFRRYRLLSEVSIDGVAHSQLLPMQGAARIGEATGAVIAHRVTAELVAGLSTGLVEFDDERDEDTPEELERRRKHRDRLLSDKPDRHQLYIRFWRAILRDVDRRLPPGLKTARVVVDGVRTKRLVLQDVLDQLGEKYGLMYFGKARSVSVSQYYRVRAKRLTGGDDRDMEPNTSARGNRNQLLPEVKRVLRDTIAEKLEAARHAPRKGDKPATSVKDIAATVYDRLEELKAQRPELADKIKLPSKTTFYDTVGQAPARLRVLAVRKSVATARDFRRPWGHEEPDFALSQVQYDETLLPLYCYCDVLKIPLGRPWLAWLVDVYSNAIIGFYLGFEPPGDAVFASVFRHAAMPKSYVSGAYPDIAQPYPMSGIPRFVTFDNSLSAHGNSIERLLGDLDVPWDFTLARMPWLKGAVENSFHLLNLGLLSELPGFVLPQDVDRSDYDPKENGLIGFLHLLWIVHRYLLEVYHPNPPTIGGPSPNVRWQEGTRIVKPRYPRTGQDLDFLFGIVREGVTLDHRGVLYEGIRYYSEGVDGIRYWNGANVKVSLKVNPVNLSRIQARYGDGAWVTCHALNKTEAQVSLHVHKLRQRHSERLFGKADWESRIKAEVHLRGLMRGAVLEDHGTRVSGLLARALGIGTHVVFGQLGLGRQLPYLQDFSSAQSDVPLRQLTPPDRTLSGVRAPPSPPALPPGPASPTPTPPTGTKPVTATPTVARFGTGSLPRRVR